MGGKGGGSPSLKPGPMEKEQARILKETEAQLGAPLRAAITPQVLGTLGGPGVFQTELPAVDRQTIEGQYKQARSNILETSPARGGAMMRNLADLERGRAFDVASATNEAKQRGIERALGLVPAFLPGAQQMAGAASTEAQRRLGQFQQQFQAQQQAQAGLGQGIGGLLSMAVKGKGP